MELMKRFWECFKLACVVGFAVVLIDAFWGDYTAVETAYDCLLWVGGWTVIYFFMGVGKPKYVN